MVHLLPRRLLTRSWLFEVDVGASPGPLLPRGGCQLRYGSFVPSVLQGASLYRPRGNRTNRCSHDVRVRLLFVTKEESGQPSFGNVPMRIVLRALARKLVHHNLGEPHDPEIERPSSGSRPWTQPIRPSLKRIHNHGAVLHQPCHDWVVHGHAPTDARLKTKSG